VLCRVLCALLFLAWTAEVPGDPILYCGHWRSPLAVFGPLFVSLPGIHLVAWQVLLLALAPLGLLWPGAWRRRAWSMDAAILASFASVTVTFLWGWMRGGSAYNAYYQLWRFLVALLVAAVLLSVVRTSRHLKALGITLMMAALVRATLVIYFYWAHVYEQVRPDLISEGTCLLWPPPHMTTHDDSLLFVAGSLTAISWALASGKPRAWIAGILVSAHLSYAMILNNRRLAWIELLLVLALAYLVLPRGKVHRRVSQVLLVGVPVVLLYFVVGWDRPGAVFAPVRALSTAGSNEDASSLARLEEIRNLLYTLTTEGNPLLGTGWGQPYQKVTSVYANFGPEWWQYRYLPHNSLLGMAVFGGLVGIFGMWLVVPVAAFLAIRGYRGSTRAVDRAAAMAALCILPAYGAQCYGDIGLQSLTCGLILAVALAVAGKVSAWGGAPPAGARKGGARGVMAAAAPELIPERQ
jgi:hypothetical protein